MKILLFLGFIGISIGGDAGIGGGVYLRGLHEGHFEEGFVGVGLGGRPHAVIADGSLFHDGYRGEPLLGPPLDIPFETFPGVHQSLHLHNEPYEGYAYGYRRPVHYNEYNGWRPIVKKPIGTVKKVVLKRPIVVGPPVLYKPSLAAAPLLKSNEHGHGHHLHEPTLKNPEVPIYKPLYKPTPVSVTPSLSYGYSYKLVPTYSYGPAVLNDHGFQGHGLNQGHEIGHGHVHGLHHGHGLGYAPVIRYGHEH